ncbi:MAG: response regulator transcription factor [Opitutales bacterium]
MSASPTLNQESLRRFSEACSGLYQAGLSLETFPALAFRFLQRLVSAEFVVFGSLDHGTAEMDMATDHRVPRFGEAMEAFGRVMGQYDLFRWDPDVNDGRPFCRSDFFSDRQFRKLDVYDSVYRVLGIDNHCAVHVPSDADETVFFGIERQGGPDFSGEDRFLLELGQQQLTQARNLALLLDSEREGPIEPGLLIRAGLTAREAEVLTWITEGKSNEEIGIILGIGVYTVKGHLKRIFQKTGACSRLAAALWAIRFVRRQRLHRLQPNLKTTSFVPRLN